MKKFIEYDNQNFFQLASIQIASLGLSGIIIGKHLAMQYGTGVAICSIALGDLILWLIAIAVISMVDRTHSNAIDNIKNYFGKYAGVLAALIFVISMLNWYVFEINASVTQIEKILKFDYDLQKTMTVRLGAALGILSALLSLGGIRLLKNLTVYSLPFLILYYFYSLIHSDYGVIEKKIWGISFWAVLSSILLLLPGIINFPTFFRHSRSKTHSILALSVIAIFTMFFEISTIWMDFNSSGSYLNTSLLLIFILLTLSFNNVLNIYLAAACWEIVAARLGEPKWFAILGLFGTLSYTFIQVSPPAQFLQDLTNSYIAILGIVLLMAYLTRLVVKHKTKNFEKSINLVAWLFGCVIATIYEIQHFLQGNQALMAGVIASVVFFLVLLFIEETAWAARVKFSKKLLSADK